MQIPADLRKFNLTAPATPKRRRLVMTSEGGPGVGKTDLFYRTFPGPKLVINIDLNAEGVEERYVDDDVLIKRVVIPAKHKREKDKLILNELMELYETSVTKDYFRSVMIDEGVALYTLTRRSFLEGLDFGDAPQTDYTAINSRMSKFYTLAKQYRFNLYIPHRQKKERVPGEKNPRTGKRPSVETGLMVCGGWKDALYESQCHIRLTKNPQFNSKGKRISKFEGQIIKCTARESLEGTVLYDDEIGLDVIGPMVFPESNEKDWQ